MYLSDIRRMSKMSSSKITLMGFHRYFEASGRDLWEYLSVPAGIDKETLIANILMRGADFECYYGDPEFLHDAMKVWSNKWYWTFSKWHKAITLEYEPLYNYDRHEEWTDESKGEHKETEKRTENKDVSDVLDSTQSSTGSDTIETKTENKVSAFDSGYYQPKDLTESESGSTTEAETTGKDSREISDDTEINRDTDGSDSRDNTHKGHLYGNIGVTTSQQMLQSELDVALFNLYDNITDIFLREFTIPIY